MKLFRNTREICLVVCIRLKAVSNVLADFMVVSMVTLLLLDDVFVVDDKGDDDAAAK